MPDTTTTPPPVAPVTEERIEEIAEAVERALIPGSKPWRIAFARALLAQQPSGDEALMRLALEELVDCPSRVGGYGKRSAVIAALRARLEGTKP
jgi:hypothetical protein